MIMLKLILVLSVSLLIFTVSFAQIEGTVMNSTGAAVPFATVMVIDPANGTVLLFSSTNKEGAYSIKNGNTPMAIEALALQVSSLGYQKETRQLRKDSLVYHFILKEEIKSLSPVIIKGERAKVRLSGDTLSYNATAFANPSDRVIEDVIKRLPGVEVTEAGRISYNGKNITNFYIEGDNLLDDKYAIGTKNIPNKIVDKIQVFENHQPIKLLSEITVTDQVDMNITFKDDAKIRPIHRAEIGGGIPGNFDGTLTSLFFLKKYKAINYVKVNNIGVDLNDELTSFNLDDFLNKRDISKPDNLLSLGTAARPQLPKYRYLFNKTGMVNTNNLVTLGEDVQVKTNVYYLNDVQQQDYRSETIIALPDNTVRYIEQQKERLRPHQLHAQLNLNINKTGYYLNNTFKGDYNPQSSNSFLNTNGSRIDQAIRNDLHDFSNELTYMFRRNRKAFEFYNFVNSVKEPQALLIEPGVNADYFNNGQAFNGLEQTASIPSFFTNTYFKFHFASLSFKQSYKIGVNTQKEHLHSSLSKITEDNEVLPLDSGINSLQWNRNRLFLENDYQWKKDRLRLNFSLPLSILGIRYSDESFGQKVIQDHFIFNPKARLEYNSGLENNVILDYGHQTNFGGIEDVYTGHILKNYRTVRSNSAPVFKSNTHTARLGFLYKKAIKLFFANLNLAYSYRTLDNIPTRIITDNLERQLAIPLTNNVNSLNVYGGISKHLFSLNTTVSGSFSWAANKINQMQNNELLPFTNYNTVLTADINSKLSDWLRLTYTIHYNHFQSEQQSGNLIRANQPKVDQIQQRMVVDFQASSNLDFNLTGEQLHSRQSFYNTSNVYFIDFLLRYKWSKYRADIEAGVKNIANVEQFSTTMVDANTSVANRYIIRGRMALLKLSFSF